MSHQTSRRDVFRQMAAVAAAGVCGGPLLERVASAGDAPPKAIVGETLVAQLFKSLDEKQRKTICMPFDHPLRLKVDNNWMIVKESIDGILTPDQQDLVKQIFIGLHSDEYAKTVFNQVEHDGGGPGTFAENCAVALFGQPGESADKFEFVLTGRHCTRRCDGNSVAGAAFGGPIFYGHAAESFNEKPDHKGNAYWYQAKRANEVFQALDGKQRRLALLPSGRAEKSTATVELKGKTDKIDGIPMTDLSSDQKQLVRHVLSDLLAPFRKADADEAIKCIEASGFDKLRLAFYKGGDIGNDGVWDVWQVEGPDMVWYFRGAPHVHAWANIRAPKA